MSAEMTEWVTYGWWCEECAEGAEDYEMESDAFLDANDHDNTEHPGIVTQP